MNLHSKDQSKIPEWENLGLFPAARKKQKWVSVCVYFAFFFHSLSYLREKEHDCLSSIEKWRKSIVLHFMFKYSSATRVAYLTWFLSRHSRATARGKVGHIGALLFK